MFPVIVSVVGMWSLVMMYRYSIGLMHRHAKIRIKGILIMAVPELLYEFLIIHNMQKSTNRILIL